MSAPRACGDLVPVGDVLPAALAEILASLVDEPGQVSACDPDFYPVVVE